MYVPIWVDNPYISTGCCGCLAAEEKTYGMGDQGPQTFTTVLKKFTFVVVFNRLLRSDRLQSIFHVNESPSSLEWWNLLNLYSSFIKEEEQKFPVEKVFFFYKQKNAILTKCFICYSPSYLMSLCFSESHVGFRENS